MRRLAVVVAAIAALLVLAPGAQAVKLAGPKLANAKPTPHVDYPGVQRLHYRVGPIPIIPGQNSIDFTSLGRPGIPLPKVPGYITRFRPDLVYATKDGKEGAIPRVDVIHLHHGVWLTPDGPTFAAGEEKTIFQAPRGYGYRYDPRQRWVLNYMLHNLTPNATSVFITYDIDFVPADTAAAQDITPVKPWWMDVSGLRLYPVFDALKGRGGADGRFTFPDDAETRREKAAIGPAHDQASPGDRTLVGTAGHLHPGGLHTDLKAVRDGRTKRLFRSEAKYFEPAGAVSWDVAMTSTDDDWRVALKAGDRLKVSATYDTRKASWYESMGIMVVWYADGIQRGAKDPFQHRIDWRGEITHGHLPENRNHGGKQAILPDARKLPDGPTTLFAKIRNFFYGAGDLNQGQRPAVIKAGQSLTFDSTIDGSKAIYHTITGCKAPCNRETGIAYPLADGPTFDSGELGVGGPPTAGRYTWQTPKSLRPGTYTYFCRIHPFMRGAFRIKKS